ncbi:DUF4340 domain-containing protein [Patescibacteria group bacterium]
MTKKAKNNLILLTVLAVLILALLLWQNPFKSSSNQADTEKLITTSLGNLETIEITRPGQSFILNKEADNWFLTSQDNVPANEALIQNLIESLTELNSGTIVSRNLEKLDNFGLTEEKVVNLKLINDQGITIIELMVGKLGGAAYTQTYVKQNNSANILLVDQNLISLVNQQDWKQPPPPPEEEVPLTNTDIIE